MVRTNVSGDLMSITSVTGDTSNNAATLGKSDLLWALEPANTWVALILFCVANINGARTSGRNPLNSSPSALSTLVTPDTLVTSSTTCLSKNKY